jgi:heme-degrading monooxygenase HmoA
LPVFVVHNRIDVPPERADAFARGFAANMKTHLARVPGLRRSVLLRPEAAGQPFVATMEFESARDFEAWRQSDSFRGAHAGTRGPGSPPAATLETFTIFEEFLG